MSIYHNIMIPTDFSAVSDSAAARVRQFAGDGVQVTVLHVVDYIPPSYAAVELPDSFATGEAIVKNARTQLEEWVERVGLSNAQTVLATGPAKAEIVSRSKALGIDLLVMGTHEEHGIARLLGSTTRAVLHDAECDVLVVSAAAR